MNKINVTIVGAGFVGTSMAAILSKDNHVKVLDVDDLKVKMINESKSPIDDEQLNKYLNDNDHNILATTSDDEALIDAKYIIISVPTNYSEELKSFNTKILEEVISNSVKKNSKCIIVIKSTIPIGFTKKQNDLYPNKIIFSPEFLREGSALEDNLYPSRIIVGGSKDCNEEMKEFGSLLKNCSLNSETEMLFMDSSEAEAVKLFSNTYLAMRVAFFNELDSFALAKNFSTLNIISGVSSDKRIGHFYNNPSFGYGGYCLPKDTKQLLYDFSDIPQKLISSIVESNSQRKDFLTNNIISMNPDVVGIYRLVMKDNSTNFRNSAIQGIINRIISQGIKVIIYEPLIQDSTFLKCELVKDLNTFKSISSLILANREHDELNDVSKKIYTRDIFNKDS